MNWMYYLFLFCSFIFPLFAQKRVQCIANFAVDPTPYNQVFEQQGYEGKVEVVSFEVYAEGLKKQKGRWHTFLRSIGWDYPRSIPVDQGVEKIIFFNVTPDVCKKYDLSRLPKEKLVLFMWEPKTVLPRMYEREIQDCFSLIYTWDDSLVDNRTYFKFYYPTKVPLLDSFIPFEERKLCTLIASNLNSDQEDELYSKRKEAILYFEQVNEQGFEFYGRRWDGSLYKSYRGEVENKSDVLKQYRFSICYENTKNVAGYITEKIFDCFAAGVVPIYWGASNVEEFIPKGCFIDKRNFASLEELHAFMLCMSKEEHETYLKEALLFLEGSGAQVFTVEHLAECLYESITR